jgi:hypothetical protein
MPREGSDFAAVERRLLDMRRTVTVDALGARRAGAA